MDDIDLARGEGFEAGRAQGLELRAESVARLVDEIEEARQVVGERLDAVSNMVQTWQTKVASAPEVKHSGQFAELCKFASSGSPSSDRASIDAYKRGDVDEARRLRGDVQRAQAPRSFTAPYGGTTVKGIQRAFLTVLAQQRRTLTRNQIAIFAGYSSKSSHTDNTLSALRTRGYLVGGADAITITREGLDALGKYQKLPTGAALREYWVGELGGIAGKFLTVICSAYPNTITRDRVAELSGYSAQSSHTDNTLSNLRTRGLITGGREALKASEELFG